MFTIHETGPYECCLPRESFNCRWAHPQFDGVAWPGQSKDDYFCKEADVFLQYPEDNKQAIFSTPKPGLGDVRHRSVWHVKVEGETTTSGDHTKPIMHSDNTNKDYIRLDYGNWIHIDSGTFKPEGDYDDTHYWYKVEFYTDLYALVRLIGLRRSQSHWNPYNTVTIAYWCFPKYDIETVSEWLTPNIIWGDASRDYVMISGMHNYYELLALDLSGQDTPPDFVTQQGIAVLTDVGWPAMKARIESEGMKLYAENSAYEYVHSGHTSETIINQAKLLTRFLFTADESFDTYRGHNEGIACERALSRSYCNDGNAYEFWKDVPKFGAEVKDVTKVLKGVGDKVDIKDLSQAYLSTHYGTQLTISDYQEWSKAMTQWMWRDRDDHCRRCGERMHYAVPSPYIGLDDGECTLTYALYYDPHWDKRSLTQLGSELGFDLSGQHVWELVPFSFVADWFHNYSEDLEAVHAGSRLLELDTYGEEISEKYTFPLTYLNGLTVTYYRRVARKVPTTYPIAEDQIPGRWKTHWLEAGALILSH